VHGYYCTLNTSEEPTDSHANPWGHDVQSAVKQEYVIFALFLVKLQIVRGSAVG
jgi:hypothetical protein